MLPHKPAYLKLFLSMKPSFSAGSVHARTWSAPLAIFKLPSSWPRKDWSNLDVASTSFWDVLGGEGFQPVLTFMTWTLESMLCSPLSPEYPFQEARAAWLGPSRPVGVIHIGCMRFPLYIPLKFYSWNLKGFPDVTCILNDHEHGQFWKPHLDKSSPLGHRFLPFLSVRIVDLITLMK